MTGEGVEKGEPMIGDEIGDPTTGDDGDPIMGDSVGDPSGLNPTTGDDPELGLLP